MPNLRDDTLEASARANRRNPARIAHIWPKQCRDRLSAILPLVISWKTARFGYIVHIREYFNSNSTHYLWSVGREYSVITLQQIAGIPLCPGWNVHSEIPSEPRPACGVKNAQSSHVSSSRMLLMWGFAVLCSDSRILTRWRRQNYNCEMKYKSDNFFFSFWNLTSIRRLGLKIHI